MKKALTILFALFLTFALALCCVAEEAAAEETAATLQDAIAAYRSAKAANALSSYEKELSDMVAAGQLTQEQADLLIKNAQDAVSARETRAANRKAARSTKNGSCQMGNGAMGRGMMHP